MIGNTDWNLSLRHNIEIVETSKEKQYIPVPYDFDYSGFVNANYARPYPGLPVSNVRERFFQWRGDNHASLLESLDHFRERKEPILELISNCQWASQASIIEMYQYISSFFDIIESTDPLENMGIKK